MSSFIADWLNLLFRWAHLIAGISWIGTSFYFVALDFSLRKREAMNPGVLGTAWEVHGGGFYHVEKYLTAPHEPPEDLIWFRWEAYLTWITGFLLLIVQFYWNAGTYLIDPSVMPMQWYDAIAISVGGLIAGWVIYDGMCRSPLARHPAALAASIFLLIIVLSWGFTHVFSGRGALIHIGSVIGTIMAANVFAIIIPNQRKITEALIAGREPDPAYGAIGKQRSLHNTYLTLPVLLLMISNHYPMLTNHPHSWVLVALIVVGGAALRHFLVRHEVGDPLSSIAWTLPIILGTLLIAAVMTAPKTEDVSALPRIGNDAVLAITKKHCAICHSQTPTHEAFTEAPKGTKLETIEDLQRYADLIGKQAVHTNTMPLGNETGMTDEERRTLGIWLKQNR
ncbi:MAG TPA: urate hydroxylase PuuD [Aestuariivirgaceae bacterium]|nr:urate hydroxylase PuuD [Aestuariivirgaceae bacterium]